MTERTPAPWECKYFPKHRIRITGGTASTKICDLALWDVNYGEQMANAAFIIRAVNSHDALVEALEAEDILIRKAQELLCLYLHPDSGKDANEVVSELLGLLDGPEQRAAQGKARTAFVALAAAREGSQ